MSEEERKVNSFEQSIGKIQLNSALIDIFDTFIYEFQ